MSASYPSAVKAFGTRNNGDTIQASHIDDLQDEVTAIESGLLMGTAPISASNASFVHLTVSGTSTLVGDVGITGNLTVTGGISGGATVLLHHSSTQSIPTNAWSALNFDTEDVTVASMHSTGANSSRVIAALSSGVYQLVAAAHFDYSAVSTAIFALRFIKNDTTVIGTAVSVPNLPAGTAVDFGIGLNLVQLHRFQSTADYVCVQVFHRHGAALQVGDAANAQFQHFFSMRKV